MKAVVLCAGLGTRLMPLTANVPKCMMDICGKPVLEHLVDHLANYGIFQIIVNLHHKPLAVMDYFKARLVYTYEPELLGEDGTIDSLVHWIGGEFCVVMNGDTLTNIDLNRMFDMSKGKNIRAMDKGIYTGTKILSPEYFTGDRKFIDYEDSENKWIDMGTPEGLARARKDYEKFNSLSKMLN